MATTSDSSSRTSSPPLPQSYPIFLSHRGQPRDQPHQHTTITQPTIQALPPAAQDDVHLNTFLSACTDEQEMHRGLNILYVSPTATSLANFTAICKSPFFQQYIEHIIYIPRVGYGADGPAGDDEIYADFKQSICESTATDQEVEEGLIIFSDLVIEHQYGVEAVENPEPLGDITEAIIAELRAGFNADPLWFSDSLLEDYALKNLARIRSSHAGVSITDYIRNNSHFGTVRLDALFGALASTQESQEMLSKIKTLTLGDGHCSQIHRDQMETYVPIEDLANLFANLDKLTISSTAFPNNTFISEFWKGIIQCSLNLQELTIFEDSSQMDEGRMDVAHTALRFGEFHSLRKADFVDNEKKPGLLMADEFEAFAMMHRVELRDIFLKGYLLCNATEGENPIAAMAGCLETIKDNMNLSHFEMHVYRRDEHDSHGECTSGGTSACDETCERYFYPDGGIHRSDVGRMAQDLGVFQHARGWNFGDYVMGPQSAAEYTLWYTGQATDEGNGEEANMVQDFEEGQVDLDVEGDGEFEVGGDWDHPAERIEDGEMTWDDHGEMAWDSDETMY